MDSTLPDLVRLFLATSSVPQDELADKESIFTELASRVLNRYTRSVSPPSAIHASAGIEAEFLLAEIKRFIIVSTGSNRNAVEFDLAAQRFLVDKSFGRQAEIVNFLYRLSRARASRTASQKTVLELVGKTGAAVNNSDVVERLGRTRLDLPDHPRAPSPAPAGQSSDELASDSYKRAIGRVAALTKKLDTVSEQSLLNDFVRVLRGHDGEHIVYCPDKGGFALKPRVGLTGLTRGFVEQLIVYADTTKRIRQRVAERAKAGRIRSAFCGAVADELQLFADEADAFEKDLLGFSASGVRLSLPQLLVRLNKWRLLVLVLDKITASLNDTRGSGLLDELLKYLDYEDNHPARMTVRLFDKTSCPMIAMLDHFVCTGDIDDPHHEFFICTATATAKEQYKDDGDVHMGNQGLDWWDSKFAIVQDRVPKYLLGTGAVEQVLLLGKTKYLLGGQKSDLHSEDRSSLDLRLSPSQVHQMIDKWQALGQQQNRQAVQLLLTQHKLAEHLRAIKRFMLLSEGDFSQSLMELLSDALGRPASTLLRHNLVGILESAAALQKGVDGDVLGRLDVRLLDSANAKSQGWDVFCLDYRLDPHLTVVISPEAMLEYARMSHFLWSLKRVDYMLCGAWGRLSRSRRLFAGDMAVDQRRLELLISEMRTFVQQIISGAYQCIEHAFLRLSALHDSALSVDELRAQHRDYIASIRSAFLPWSNAQLRNKLGQICASCLRTADSLTRHFVHHALCVQEKDKRDRGMPPSLPEDRFQAFLLHQTKQLNEHRSAFQALARAFQADLDEFVGIAQREAAVSATDAAAASSLLAFVDLSGYHSRRIGFDAKKYSGPAGLAART